MDFCCGTTMAALLAPYYSEGRALLTDVPFLVCNTCGRRAVAPGVELDVSMYSHYCETDGLRTASLYDVVDKSRIEQILAEYPSPSGGGPIVTEGQIDHLLDLWNFAVELGDAEWLSEIRGQLGFLLNVRSRSQQSQKQEQPVT